MSWKHKCRPSAHRPQGLDTADLLKPTLREDPMERLPIGPLITDESQITDEYIEDFFRRMEEQGFTWTPTPEDTEEAERIIKRLRDELARRASSPDQPSPK
jgi:hypothetical protein